MKDVANYVFRKGLERTVEKAPNSFFYIWKSKYGSATKICFTGISVNGDIRRKLLEIDLSKKNGKIYIGPKKSFYDVDMKLKKLSLAASIDVEEFTLEDIKNKNLFTVFTGKVHNLSDYRCIFEDIIVSIYSKKFNLPVAVEVIEI